MILASEIILLGDGTVFGTSDGELEPCEDVLSDVYVLIYTFTAACAVKINKLIGKKLCELYK